MAPDSLISTHPHRFVPCVFWSRFKFQAVIDGRRFPPAEAGSKKLAKQEAAAHAMKILLREVEHEGEDGLELEKSLYEDSSLSEAEPVRAAPHPTPVAGRGRKWSSLELPFL